MIDSQVLLATDGCCAFTSMVFLFFRSLFINSSTCKQTLTQNFKVGYLNPFLPFCLVKGYIRS